MLNDLPLIKVLYTSNVTTRVMSTSKWIGRRIRELHLLIGVLAAAATMVLPLRFVKFGLLWWSGMILANHVYKKCPLTKIEMYLTNENVTVVDDYLRVLHKEITNKNRKDFTVCAGVFMILVSVFRLLVEI